MRTGVEALPAVLPVFPLPGVVLLPRGRLPLNIFEPRYTNMIEDALGSGRHIGMVQPLSPDKGLIADDAEIYDIGGLGRITTFAETGDGRFLITLTGVCRFRAGRELPLMRGYRRLAPDYGEFAGDLADDVPALSDRPRLVAALRAYFAGKDMDLDWDAIDKAPDEAVVSSLALICPLEPGEKQALLECPDLEGRSQLLIGLLEMALHADAPPTRQ